MILRWPNHPSFAGPVPVTPKRFGSSERRLNQQKFIILLRMAMRQGNPGKSKTGFTLKVTMAQSSWAMTTGICKCL